jgi:hypothetical protein
MLKLTSVFLFVVMFTTTAMHAQTLPSPANQQGSQPNLSRVFSKETAKLKSESASVDAKKMDKIRRQAPQKKWGTKEKLILATIIVALVGLAVVLAYNTKRCIRRSPSGCDFTDTTRTCECLEYAQ